MIVGLLCIVIEVVTSILRSDEVTKFNFEVRYETVWRLHWPLRLIN